MSKQSLLRFTVVCLLLAMFTLIPVALPLARASSPTPAGLASFQRSQTVYPSLTWHSFLGGSGGDWAENIAVDSSGNVYVAGTCDATWGDSPVRAYSNSVDAFAAKLDSHGNLIWHTFLGGSSQDRGYAIAVDGNGNTYVAGTSFTTWGSPLRAYSSSEDAFVAKLDVDGNLTWHTFLGGSGIERGEAIDVDAGGDVLVAGHSYAAWAETPVRAPGDGNDAFAAKLTSAGALTWHTFLGGSGYDMGAAIAADGSGNIYVAGASGATWAETPVRAHSGSNDAFVAKLGSNGSLTWHTFLGGNRNDDGFGIAVDGSGNAYVTGFSYAGWAETPVRAYSGGAVGRENDAFAAKLNSAGTLAWHTFLGGNGADGGADIGLDGSGNVYVAGWSDTWAETPLRAYGGGSADAFAAKLGSTGSLTWHTFLGGSGVDAGRDIAVNDSGIVYVAGSSPVTWTETPVRAHSGGFADAFAAKLGQHYCYLPVILRSGSAP